MLDVIIRRFEQPDEVREMVKGRFEVVRPSTLALRWERRAAPIEHVVPALREVRRSIWTEAIL
jgi:hypothetical protein